MAENSDDTAGDLADEISGNGTPELGSVIDLPIEEEERCAFLNQDVREEAQGSDIPPQGQVCIEMSER